MSPAVGTRHSMTEPPSIASTHLTMVVWEMRWPTVVSNRWPLRRTTRSRWLGLGSCTPASCLRAVFAVIAVVATLAHGAEIVVIDVLRLMIKVRDREDHLALGPRRRLSVSLFATSTIVQTALAVAFTSTVCAHISDVSRDSRPVVRVAAFVLS